MFERISFLRQTKGRNCVQHTDMLKLSPGEAFPSDHFQVLLPPLFANRHER